jgi:hypothetical protein
MDDNMRPLTPEVAAILATSLQDVFTPAGYAATIEQVKTFTAPEYLTYVQVTGNDDYLRWYECGELTYDHDAYLRVAAARARRDAAG